MEACLTQSTARRKLSHDALLSPFYDACKPASAWRVGAEAEKFGVLEGTHEPLPYEGERSVTAVLRALERFGWQPESEYPGGAMIALKRGEASITLEPGAQLELSGAPLHSIHDTRAEWERHIAELREVGGELGIAWLGLGFHPFAAQSELPWVPKLRYGIMRDYLPTRGSMGLDMMRRTCTVQSNLDYASEADAMRKLRASLAVSPIVTGMFANSPFYEGALTGEHTRRGLVWLNTDPDRTGLLEFLWDDGASFERYVEWALDVPMFLVKRDNKVVHNTGQTFRAFMRDGYQGVEATEDDWLMHLGTVFPEVRLKRTIEIRGADCLPYTLTPALSALSKGLLYDEAALAKLESALRDVSYRTAQNARREIARRGLSADFAGRPLLDWAREVVAIAREGLTRIQERDQDPRGNEALYLEPLEHLLERGETPTDALVKQLDAGRPLAPQIIELARL